MRRKSERTKEKEKSSPEKKIEKTPRRSRRQSRRRKGSVSSPDRDESGTEENETSMRSSQEDTEEEQVASLEETSSQVGAVITPDLANTSEVDEGNQSAPTRSRRSTKKHDQVSSVEDANTSANVKADSSHENEWKEDNTFWEEGSSKTESPESKHKEKEVSSPVWKVKCADVKGGEIQKLKLCIVRPQEAPESTGRKKKRIHRSSTSQQKEKSDVEDNESGKGSQEDEEKLSSDERSVSKHEIDIQEEQEQTSADKMCFDESPEDGVVQINVSEAEAVTVEGEVDASEPARQENEAGVKVDNEGPLADKTESSEESKNEGQEFHSEESQRESLPAVGGEVEPSIQQPSRSEDSSDAGSLKDHSGETAVCDEQEHTVDNIHKEFVVFDEMQITSSVIPEIDSQTNEEFANENKDISAPENIADYSHDSLTENEVKGESEDRNHQLSKSPSPKSPSPKSPSPKSPSPKSPSPKTPSPKTPSPKSPSPKSPSSKSPSPKAPSPKSPSLKSPSPKSPTKSPILKSPSPKSQSPSPKSQLPSPKESLTVDEVKNSTTRIVKIRRGSDSSDDEKKRQRNDSKDSSPRFRQRRVERLKSKEQEKSSVDTEQRKVVNMSSNKSRRHLERKSRSPQRREKVSLRRSFSGKSCDLEQKKDKDFSENKREISMKDKIQQENKENNAQKVESDSTGTLPGPRKRRWGQSNSSRPSKRPVLSISTDSLKSLIPGAKPVPIGEVQLVQDEDIKREGEIWENDKIVEKEKVKPEVKEEIVLDKVPLILPDAPRISVAVTDVHQSKIITRKISIVSDDARTLQRSPSPPRHKATNVLFITNLVRPFTVNQLKELLARTGKIIETGFWIDKIKSKCYVEYEKESEAKETRHALHGVRWPVSNPKTLSVDFGKKEDMEVAQALAESDQIPRKTEPLKIERNVDWVVEPMREKEREREVRDREKEKEKEKEKERERERDRERERGRPREKPHHAPVEPVEHSKKMVVREWDLGKIGQTSPIERDTRYDERNRERERKIRKDKPHRSRSASPHDTLARKVKKKEEDAPAKLLDDLFRKTKNTPCIYWLPLTAEQIVVKEEMRRKHMAEHERRMAEMRKAERERERVRAQQRQQRRASEREKRRRRSGSGSPKK